MKKRPSFMRRRKQLFGNRKKRPVAESLSQSLSHKKVGYMINKNPFMTADRFITKLRYSTDISLASVATASQVYFYCGNGPGLPIPGTGTRQPPGFDYYKKLYSKVRCHGSKITLRAISAANNSESTCFIGLVPTVTTYVSNQISNPTVQDIMALPYVKWQVIGNTNSMNKVMLKNFYTARKILGVKSIEYSEDYASFTVDTSAGHAGLTPALPWFWNIYVSTINHKGVLSNAGLYINATIDYYCEFYNREAIQDTNDVTGTDLGITGSYYGHTGVSGPTDFGFDYGDV